MKQAIAAFLLCLSLVLGGVALAAHTLQEDAGQVAVTAISRQEIPPPPRPCGHPELPVCSNPSLGPDHPLGPPGPEHHGFLCPRRRSRRRQRRRRVYLRFPHQDATLSAEPGYSLDNLPTSPALGPLYEQVARRTPPGQTRTEILDPSQFLDAIPFR